MVDPFMADAIDIQQGAEGTQAFDPLGAAIDQCALLARERSFLVIAFEKILADFRAEMLEQKPQAGSDRIVLQHGALGLSQVKKPDHRNNRAEAGDGPAPEGLQQGQQDTGGDQQRKQDQRDVSHGSNLLTPITLRSLHRPTRCHPRKNLPLPLNCSGRQGQASRVTRAFATISLAAGPSRSGGADFYRGADG